MRPLHSKLCTTTGLLRKCWSKKHVSASPLAWTNSGTFLPLSRSKCKSLSTDSSFGVSKWIIRDWWFYCWGLLSFGSEELTFRGGRPEQALLSRLERCSIRGGSWLLASRGSRVRQPREWVVLAGCSGSRFFINSQLLEQQQIASVMSLLRTAGLNLFRTDRVPVNLIQASEQQAKRQRQLEYMRELDRQIQEKNERSKSKSRSNSRGKKDLANSMLSNPSAGKSYFATEHEKYYKSAVLEQMLKVDYQTFKQIRPKGSHSRSNKKYHLLEEIGNEGDYKPIPEYKTIFVDSQGKEIQSTQQTIDKIVQKSENSSKPSRSRMRDDKNYSPQSVQKIEKQDNKESEYSKQFENESQYAGEKQDKPETAKSKELRPVQKQQNLTKSQVKVPDIKLEEMWKVNSLFLAHKLSKGSVSDRLSSTLNENKHRFPEIFSFLQSRNVQNELSELGQIISVVVKEPNKQHFRSSSVRQNSLPRPDQLNEIKDIISDIQKISKPTVERINRFADTDIELHQKINKRLGLDRHFHDSKNGVKHRYRNQEDLTKRNLDELIQRYEMTRLKE